MAEVAPRVRKSSSRARLHSEVIDGAAMDAGIIGEQSQVQRAPVPVGRSLEASMPEDICMEIILEKLKLLDYERDLCKRKKPYKKPLSRVYFAFPTPSGTQSEQFFYFTSLVAWLLQSVGVDFPTPKEFDEPISLCSNIITSAKRLGFASPSYPATVLRNGYGREVCGVLEGLVDYVLESKGLVVRRPIYPTDSNEEDADADDDADVLVADMAEATAEADHEEEEAYMGGSRGIVEMKSPRVPAAPAAEKAVLTSKVDPTLWKLELERVTPKLKITLASDAKDWRSHLDTAHTQNDQIRSTWPQGKNHLDKMQTDISSSLDKLKTRERYLNEQFEHLIGQYRLVREQLSGTQGEYNKKAESVSERNNELHRIQEQLDETKRIMDERGSNISDTSPVVRIKAAIKKVNEELKDMEVRVGVVAHTLLTLSLRDKTRLHASLSEEFFDN